MTALLLRRAAVRPGREVDLLVVDGHLAAGPVPVDAHVVDLAGRPVLPGLADHHVHLMALAAGWDSVDLSPPALAAGGGLDAVLATARRDRPSGWLRGIGYDIGASGPLDRRRLDQAGAGPVRVQDRTGSRWVLDGVGLSRVLDGAPEAWPDGVERDAAGVPTGVLVRLDDWLRRRLAPAVPDLGTVGRWLAGRGVTEVTDAGAANGRSELAALAAADLPLRVTAMTGEPDLAPPPGVRLGPVKVLLDDDRLPPLDALADRIGAARAAGRSVAVHCVTEVQLVLAVAAGLGPADRIEHATFVPAGLLDLLATARPTVVVEPGLVATRGDRYLDDHGPEAWPALHRLRSLQRAGLRVAAGTDAPYGPADPWVGIAAAVDRRTPSGRVLGAAEALDDDDAVALFTGRSDDPGRGRRLQAGDRADLVVLDDGWDRVAARPAVLATLLGGELTAGCLPG